MRLNQPLQITGIRSLRWVQEILWISSSQVFCSCPQKQLLEKDKNFLVALAEKEQQIDTKNKEVEALKKKVYEHSMAIFFFQLDIDRIVFSI